MLQRLWLFRVPVGRIGLLLLVGVAVIAATISGLGWFTPKSNVVTTGAKPTLIGAAATLDLTNAKLVRAKQPCSTSKGVAQRELEQATSNQQTAEGAVKAAGFPGRFESCS